MYQYIMVLMEDKPLNGIPGAEDVIGDGEISNLSRPGSLPLLLTVASKVTEAQSPQCLQYHPIQIAWMDLDTLDEAGGLERRCI